MNDVSGIPQYPWDEGDTVFASALNAAIANTQGTSAVLVSDTPPAAGPGTLWWDSAGTGLYIRYNDGNSTQWVVAQNQNTGGEGAVVNVLNHGAKGDGTTDDTAAIQAVLNAYAGKATVFVPDTGHSYIVGQLMTPAGTDLLIHGTLLMKAGTNGVQVYVQNVSNVTVRGHGTLDGNGANQTAGAGINVYNSTNVQISGLTVQNAFNWNFSAVLSKAVMLYGVKMLHGGNANQFANACDSCWITNCTMDGPTTDYGFAFYGGVTNSGIIGCVVRNASAGIFVFSDAGQPARCENITICDSIVYNNFGGGIVVDLNVATTHENVIIANNRVYGNNTSNGATVAEIWVDHTNGATVTGNLVSSGDGAVAASTYGIGIGSGADDVTVTGNSAYNIGNSSIPGFGLWVNSASVVQANGNTFHDYRPTAYMSGIGGTAGTVNAYTNNLFGHLTGRISFASIQPDTAIFNADGQGFGFGQALPTNAANDAAAATAGVPVGGVYRNGSVLQVRVA